MKKCNVCKEAKSLSSFHKRQASRDGHGYTCKPCALRRCQSREQRSHRRDYKLQHNYNLSLEQYNSMLDQQGGVCRVCQGTNPNGFRLAVDHDHSCCPGDRSCGACVRGLLCMDCNRGLGMFRDDVDRLRAALEYLNDASSTANASRAS